MAAIAGPEAVNPARRLLPRRVRALRWGGSRMDPVGRHRPVLRTRRRVGAPACRVRALHGPVDGRSTRGESSMRAWEAGDHLPSRGDCSGRTPLGGPVAAQPVTPSLGGIVSQCPLTPHEQQVFTFIDAQACAACHIRATRIQLARPSPATDRALPAFEVGGQPRCTSIGARHPRAVGLPAHFDAPSVHWPDLGYTAEDLHEPQTDARIAANVVHFPRHLPRAPFSSSDALGPIGFASNQGFAPTLEGPSAGWLKFA
ncbi:hypothetical protein C8E84_1714 [Ornithinibacter aureus]|nr:hypothetical protein C8E84_1714 [Ornithinibacter aureus]